LVAETCQIRSFDSDYKKDLFNLANPLLVLSHDPTVPFNGSDLNAVRPIIFAKTCSCPGLTRLSLPDVQAAADIAYFEASDRRDKLEVALIEQRTTEEERRSVSTAFDARDMAAVVDALGEPDGLLNYYGVSYGTVLGVTFAAMLPDKVGRMVLDGVSGECSPICSCLPRSDTDPDLGLWTDTVAWYNDWEQFIENAVIGSDDVSHEFFRLCAQAGPDRCALATNDTSLSAEDATRAVDDKIRATISGLYKGPLPVLADEKASARSSPAQTPT
jgi:hypothetical protein